MNGFLPLAEAMATKTASLVPNHSALSEWPNGAVHYISAPNIYVATNGLNTIHFVPDKESAIDGLHKLYTDDMYRNALAEKAYHHMQQEQFNWKVIAHRFMDIFKGRV